VSAGVKFRPDSTTSERQLMIAMAADGRPVALAELVRWRKDGLLPQLAAQGLGQGRGKTYYWGQSDILAHARAAYDFLAKYGRPDASIRMLWLSGFVVPLPRLRRAWLHHLKVASTARRRGDTTNGHTHPRFRQHSRVGDHRTASSLLLEAALTLCGVVGPGEEKGSPAVIGLIEHACARLGYGGQASRYGKAAVARLWSLVRMIGTSAQAGHIIAEAHDAQLQEAHRYFSIAARFLQDCTGDTPPEGAAWSAWLAESVGPSLFVLTLVLLRSEGCEMLDRIATRMEGAKVRRRYVGRQGRPSPAPAVHFLA